jgi:molybdopterin-biosynthesis enzyme MoeA-like protein
VQAAPILSVSVDAFVREGDFAAALEAIQQRYATVEIGSYPFNRDGRFGATLVARGTDAALLSQVSAQIVAAITALGGETKILT